MCGRYASFIAADRLHRLFRTVNPTPNLQPTWNMAPTAGAALGARPESDAPADQCSGRDAGDLADVP
jgi:putative SOS response-associated peptidase YedK